MNITDASNYNSYVDEYNSLVGQYEYLREEYNRKVIILNQFDINVISLMRISGGINLEPQNFKIKKTAASRNLNSFIEISKKVKTNWLSLNGSGEWIRSGTKVGNNPQKKSLPETNWVSTPSSKDNGVIYEYKKGDGHKHYWASNDSQTGSWRDLLKNGDFLFRERMFDNPDQSLHIAEYKNGKLVNYIVGKMANKERLVFSRSTRTDLMKPQQPPIWWKKENGNKISQPIER
ncbi:hypothetical protein ACFL6U_18420 [Planctomycetota bacterium]